MHTHWGFCVCSDLSFPKYNSQIGHQVDLPVLAFQIMAKCPRPSESECSSNSPWECLQSKLDAAALWPCTALIIGKKLHDRHRDFSCFEVDANHLQDFPIN